MVRAYSVYDTEKEKFSNPIYTLDDGTDIDAIRIFKAQIYDRNNMIALFPDVYELRYIGKFDDTAGCFINEYSETVITGSEALEELRNESH